MNNFELFEKSKRYVPGGVHSPVRSFKGLHCSPRFINRALGAYLWDEEGKKYLDFCMSFGPLILGHQNERVKKAIQNALDRGWSYGACEKYSLELAEFIVDQIPFIEQIRFVNSGTEAVMTAVRLARGVTGREKIIKFNGCYHGHLDAMLIKAGSGLAEIPDASSKGVTSKQIQDTLIAELGELNQVEKFFLTYPDQIAAVFIEPLPANYGLLVQEISFLKGLRDLCHRHGALLVFDEVISGFRIGFGGMSEQTGIFPDLVAYGKIIGGGLPVGAVAGSRAIMEFLAPSGPVYQAGTLSGNPVAMAAGLETLKQLTPQKYHYIDQMAQLFSETLLKWMKNCGFEDYSVKKYASLFWPIPEQKDVKSLKEIPSNLSERFYYLFKALLEKGIYLAPSAWEVCFCSLSHNEEVLEDLKQRLWN